MKTKEKYLQYPVKGILFFSILILLAYNFVGCNASSDDVRVIAPPDPNIETAISDYYPDSGGVATKLILHGTNFGTDTSYIKVYVNNKKAAIIGCDGEAIYAIVPSRADSGEVRVVIGKSANIKEYIYPIKFKYFFKENVTTVCGQNGISGIEDGDVNTATLRRPWNIAFDNDGTLFFLDEGRGISSDGGLRKYADGNVETIMRNSSGVLQSPTGLVFNATQDTLFMVQTIYSANNMTSTASIAYLTRNEGFSVIKPYIKTDLTFRATGIAIHPKTGDIFFNSYVDGSIYKANKYTGAYENICQVNGTNNELRMIFDPQGTYLYIIVKDKHCIYRAKYNSTTRKVENPTVFAGQWNASGYLDGIGIAAKFNTPGQGTFDPDGNLYIPDKGNHCIRKITPAGVVTTFAGIGGTSGYKDGDPLESLFNNPECITYNPADDGWYVADRENSLIRKILVE